MKKNQKNLARFSTENLSNASKLEKKQLNALTGGGVAVGVTATSNKNSINVRIVNGIIEILEVNL